MFGNLASLAARRLRGVRCEGRLGTKDTDVPLRLHTPEVGSSMLSQALLGVQDVRAAFLSGEHYPMPEGPPLLEMPFDGQQRKIRECVPSAKRYLRRAYPQAKVAKQFAHMGSFRPQPLVVCRDAQRARH